MDKIGIDVSHWQGNIDWKKVKMSGVDFAILKAGGSDNGLYTDNKFNYNYHSAKAQNIPVGTYFFIGKSFNTANSIRQAQYFLSILKGKSFELPIFIDVETLNSNNKNENTNAVLAFCDWMEKHNAFIGIYGSDVSTFSYMLHYKKLDRFAFWVARYGVKPSYVTTWQIWQYSSKSRVPGISGNVDRNVTYIDYPKIIVKKGLNRF